MIQSYTLEPCQPRRLYFLLGLVLSALLAATSSGQEQNTQEARLRGRVFVQSVGLSSPKSLDAALAAEKFNASLRELKLPEARLYFSRGSLLVDRKGTDPGLRGLNLPKAFGNIPLRQPELGQQALVSITAAVRPGDAALVAAGTAPALATAQEGVALERCLERLIGKNRDGPAAVVLLDVEFLGSDRAATTAALDGALKRMVARWPNLSVWRVEGGRGELSRAFTRAVAAAGNPYSLAVCLRALWRDPALSGAMKIYGSVSPAQALDLRGLIPPATTETELIVQRGHADEIVALAVTADGRRLFTGSEDSTVRVWNRDERLLLNVLPEPLNGVTALALSPDERQLVYSDRREGLWAWDVLTRRAVQARRAPAGRPVSKLGILADGSKVVVLSDSLYFWDLPPGNTYKPIATGKKYGYLAVSSRAGGAAFAAANDRGLITLFDAAGTAVPVLDGPKAKVSSLALAADGAKLAVGSRGEVAVWDVTRAAGGLHASAVHSYPLGDPALKSAVKMLSFGPTGQLAASVGDEVVLIAPGGSKPQVLPLPPGATVGQVVALVFSDDGRWLCAVDGREDVPLVWELRASGIRPLTVGRPPTTTGVAGLRCASFTPARRLLAGDAAGDVHEWLLPQPGNNGAAEPQKTNPVLDHSGGRVAHLDVTTVQGDEGYLLLQVSRDEREARFWDLRRGFDNVARAPLPGKWRNGVLVPGRAEAVLVDEDGRLTGVDLTGKPIHTDFALPKNAQGVEFEPLCVSPDGKLVAAGSLNAPHLVCVWDLAPPKPTLTHVIRGHDRKVNAVSFSRQAQFLVTASDDWTAKVWNLKAPTRDPNGELSVPFSAVDTGNDVNAVVFLPELSDRPKFVTGGSNGRVLIWRVGQKENLPLREVDELKGRINTLTVARNGHWLAASTATSKEPWLWDLFDERLPVSRLRLPQPHSEQITAIAPWPNGDLIATASFDATIRFWDLRKPDKALVATLATQSTAAAARNDNGDWVAFTPDGLFDGSHDGRNRVAWRMPGFQDVVPLEHFYKLFFHAGLLRDLIFPPPAGRPTPKNAALVGRLPPPLIEVVEPTNLETSSANVTLKVVLTDQGGGFGPDALSGRLGLVPLGMPAPESIDADRRTYLVPVGLAPGENPITFVSNNEVGNRRSGEKVVRIVFKTAAPAVKEKRLFVLAVGVKNYANPTFKLEYPDADATEIGLAFKELSKPPFQEVKVRMLLNADATNVGILSALEDLARQTQPDDTLVLFLAGHGGMIEKDYNFYPYEMRAEGDTRSGVSIDELSAKLDSSLCKAKARLLILDTCASGGAIATAIRNAADGGAKESGLMIMVACSANGRAHESDKLKHGVLTYSLLATLGRVPAEQLALKPNRNPTGQIYANDWFQDARRTIRDSSAKALEIFGTEETQMPQIAGDNESAFQNLVLFQLPK